MIECIRVYPRQKFSRARSLRPITARSDRRFIKKNVSNLKCHRTTSNKLNTRFHRPLANSITNCPRQTVNSAIINLTSIVVSLILCENLMAYAPR